MRNCSRSIASWFRPPSRLIGGKYIVRGGASEVVEGEGTPHRTVIIEFENFEKAKAWHGSDEYAGPKQMRIDSTNSSVIIVDGV